MSEAPERIWAQDAQPDECDYTGGGWWDDECGNTQYPHIVEYIRADLARPMTVADAAKVLLDAMEGADGMDISAFMGAADEMARDMYNGLGPIPMLSSAMRALSQPHN